MNRKDLEGKLILLMHLRRIRRKKAIQEKEKKSFELEGFFKLGRIWENTIESSMNKDLEI